MNEHSVRTTGEPYDHRKSGVLEGFDVFVDETSAAGLQAGLVNGDKIIFSDEGENILKNNGLLVEENASVSSTYDLYTFVLSYYGSLRTFNKELKSGSLAANIGRLTISCLSTSEPIIRMLGRRFSGGQVCPMLERFAILFAETKPKYSFQRTKAAKNKMASLSQYIMVLGQINNIDFYFEDDAENLYASYGDALTYTMKQHERSCPWLSTRFGKSRDQSLRLCALLQGLEMAAVVCHDLFLEDPSFMDGIANKRFFQAAVKKTKELFFPSPVNQRRLSIGIEIVQGAIYLTNKFIEQYREMFEPNKRELNRMDLSFINEKNPAEQKLTSAKGIQHTIDREEVYIQDQMQSTLIKHGNNKLTKKKAHEDEDGTQVIPVFDPTSDIGKKIIQLILNVKSAVLIKSTLSRHTTLKNYISFIDGALQYLIDDIELLRSFDYGAVVTSNKHRFIPIYVKKMISPASAKENLSLAGLLKNFSIEHSDYVATWWNVCLPSTIALSEEVYDFLSTAPYTTFITAPIIQWAPKSRQQASTMIGASQVNNHAELAQPALPLAQPSTSSAHGRTNIMPQNPMYSSGNVLIDANEDSSIDTDREKNTSVIYNNITNHQQHRIQNTTTNLNTNDENRVQKENCQQTQKRSAPVESIDQSLPLLPTGILPTATNLMATRQPSTKRRKK